MKTLKFIITLAIILFTITLQSQNDSYSFFVAGHTYGAPGVDNEGFHPLFKQKFNYIQSRTEIKFGVLTGDIVSPNPTEQDWDEIDTDIGTLGLPIHFAVGNHDMENRPLFESRYGITYYYFIYQDDLFIVLDPNIDEWNISGEQLEFLKNVVNENAEITDNIYVFFHQVLWKDDNHYNYIKWNSSAGRADTINFWIEVEPIFHQLTNDVVMFAGDVGAGSWATDISYDQYDNITLITSGMGDEDGENFIVVNVDSNKSITYDTIYLSDSDVTETDKQTKNYDTVIYPNPASKYITISHNKIINKIQLFNIQGELVKETYPNKLEDVIDVDYLKKGIYS